MRNIIVVASLFVLSVALNGCGGGPGGGGSDPNAGFKLETYAYSPIDTTVFIPTAGNVQGALLSTNGSTTGTITSFNQNFGGVGLLVVTGAKVPARWRFRLAADFVPGSLCLQPTLTDLDMHLNSQEKLFCPGRLFGFSGAPSSIDATTPPATMVFYGSGADNTYGTPDVVFYDEFGSVVASAQVSQILYDSGQASGVSIAIPNLTGLYDGVYTVSIRNQDADGSREVIGAAPVTIYGNPPPPPPPPPDPGDCSPAKGDDPQLECEPLIN